jgi:hypothetical protein
MNSYGEETLWQNEKFLKLISVPSFHNSHSLVLLDLDTMDSYQITFDLSKEIAQVGEQLEA